jgi:hypothetical protein
MTNLTAAQQKQLNALSGEFVSMKKLREDRKGANLNVLYKLIELGLVERRDPNKDLPRFVCEELEWRAI